MGHLGLLPGAAPAARSGGPAAADAAAAAAAAALELQTADSASSLPGCGGGRPALKCAPGGQEQDEGQEQGVGGPTLQVVQSKMPAPAQASLTGTGMTLTLSGPAAGAEGASSPPPSPAASPQQRSGPAATLPPPLRQVKRILVGHSLGGACAALEALSGSQVRARWLGGVPPLGTRKRRRVCGERSSIGSPLRGVAPHPPAWTRGLVRPVQSPDDVLRPARLHAAATATCTMGHCCAQIQVRLASLQTCQPCQARALHVAPQCPKARP